MKVTIIPGDFIGPEIISSTLKVLDALNIGLEYEIVNAGEKVYKETGELIPNEVYKSLEKNKVALKGPITTPIGKGFRSVNVALRKKYDLYANIRPIKSIGKVASLHENLNLILFRENTEDLYAGIEKRISENERHSIKVITREKSERIIKAAFEYAKKHDRKKVAVVTKANIMKETDGLFLDIAREIGENYPEIKLQEVLVDNMCMQLVMNPNQYEVIVTQNLYGDILSDLMAGLIGGLGIVPGANIGKDMAIFEAVHGSAPDIAGKGVANPTAVMLSACMMLDYINEKEAADRVRRALDITLSDKDNFTRDLGGKLNTQDFTNAIIKNL